MTRRIRLLALLVVVAWLAIGGVGGPLVGKLSALQKNDQASFLPVDAESKRAADELAPFTAGAGLPYFVVITREGDLRPQDAKAAQAYAASLAALPLAEHPEKKLGDVLSEPPRAAVPSKDGKALLVPVNADQDAATGKIGESSGASVIAATLREEAARTLAKDGMKVQVTGPGGFVADLSKAFAGIDGLLLGVALAVVLIILLIVYRSPILPFAVLFSAVFGLAAAALVIYPLAQAGVIAVSGQSQGILSILVVGAATDYALLIVARYREELHQTESEWQAMRAAWRGTVEPVSASAATVVLGLLCLLLAQLGGTRGLGPISALGIAGALAGALTFLPAVLLLVGRRIFWPRIPRVDHAHAEEKLRKSGAWARVARAVASRPRTVWVGVTALLVLAAAFAPTFKAEGLTQAQLFRTSVESVEGTKTLAAHFPGGTGSPAQIVVPQERAQAVADAAAAVPGVDEARVGTAPAGPPKVIDSRVVVQATLSDEAETPQAQDALIALRQAVHKVDPGLAVGGQTATVVDTRAASDRDVRVIIPAILGVVFVVLMVLLRSLVAPLLLLLANVLSFAATLGISALVFDHGFGFPGADAATPLYGFVFLIALGIDYSIFLMTRIREETPRRGTRDAVLVGLAVTGGVITSAGVVLAATFSALLVLPLVFMAQIAFLVAFGVLLDTFVVRSLLVPGLVYDLGDRVWWPGRGITSRRS